MKISRFLFISLFAFAGFSVCAQSEWHIFRGNQQLTASVANELPDQLQLLASFQTEDDIKASPVVNDGVVYCGSTDGYFYAFNLKGELKWKFNADPEYSAIFEDIFILVLSVPIPIKRNDSDWV